MALDDELDIFSYLAEAVGLVENDSFKGSWFEDPLGRADGSKRGLSSMLYKDEQRAALTAFVDEVLGSPDRSTLDDAVWVPLFTSSGTTIYVVLREVSGSVRVGFGVTIDSGTSLPSVTLRAHVPVFQLPREGGGSMDVSGSSPHWLILGREGGLIDLSVDINLSNDVPALGEAFLGGTTITASIPTSVDDQLALSVGLRRLQLPGTTVPQDLELTIDSFEDIDSELIEFVAGLVQMQAESLTPGDANTAVFSALSALLGLRRVPDIPAFPLDALISDGVTAVVSWIELILRDDASRAAWLGQLAALVGGSVDASRDAIVFNSGDINGVIGVRTGTSTGGALQLTPWLELSLSARNGADARLSADLLTIDTATATSCALPALYAAAVFGRDAAATGDLLSGDPGIGSVHTGIVLREGRPAFSLTLHDVTFGGVTHDILDLSEPDAALDAADALIESALQTALDGFGRPGELLATLIGIDPPPGIDSISVAALLSNPLAAIHAYWARLATDSDAFATVLTAAREMLTGQTVAIEGALTGAGSVAEPWEIDVEPAQLLVWIENDEIAIDLGFDRAASVLDSLECVVGLRAMLARISLAELDARFFQGLGGSILMRREDGEPARFDLGSIDLRVDFIGLTGAWTARDGVSLALRAPNLILELDPEGSATRIPGVNSNSDATFLELELPQFSADGTVTFSPDWQQLEAAFSYLLSQRGSPFVDEVLDLLGWRDNGAHVDLGVFVSDPKAALRSWLAELLLDCNNIRRALGPLCYLFSGFRLSVPLGSGNPDDPYRAAIAGEAMAPAAVAWFEPGCALSTRHYEPRPGFIDLSEPPEAEALAIALRDAARALPELRYLLHARDSLGEGMRLLAERMVGTDGVTGRPVALPEGVNGIDLVGYSYRELVALGASDLLQLELFSVAPAAIVHIGCEALWASSHGTNSIDARLVSPSDSIAATIDGQWSVALPLPAAAAADRADRGAVGEQAMRLQTVLANRTAPVTLVAYGAAGAAALSAARQVPAVERVVTVGSPWSPLATNAYGNGLSGDALLLMNHLRTPPTDIAGEEILGAEASIDLQMNLLIERAMTFANPDNSVTFLLPDASAETRRAGLDVDAVFGLLDSDSVEAGMAAFVMSAIDQRYEQYTPPSEPPEELHAGIDIPVLSIDVGALRIGAGARLELVTFDRGLAGDSFRINNAQRLILDIQVSAPDGWLVGGPGALQRDVSVRWLAARIELPLAGDLGQGTVQITLHEASCFGVERERWLIDATALDFVAEGVESTLATSEIHIMLAEVVSRISATSNELAVIFAEFGLLRDGGYDPSGFDRLLFDTVATINDALIRSAVTIADALRVLAGVSGEGSVLHWSVDAASVTVDLQTRDVDVTVQHSPANLPPLTITLGIDSQGLALAATLGSLDSAVGGLMVKAAVTSHDSADQQLSLCWQQPGVTSPNTINLLAFERPEDLNKLLATLLPASIAHALLDNIRSRVEDSTRAQIERLLDGLALLGPTVGDSSPRMILPWSFFCNPTAWLRHVATGWRVDPMGEAVATLEALAPLVVPDRTEPGWPLSEDVSFVYDVVEGRLDIVLNVAFEHALIDSDINIAFAGGVSWDGSSGVLPILDTLLTIDDVGIRLLVNPAVSLDLLGADSLPSVQLYPLSSGLGPLLTSGAGSAITALLNALIAERNNASASLRRDTARLVFDLGNALNLLEGESFSDTRIADFANDPVTALRLNLASLAGSGTSQLAAALDPMGELVSLVDEGAGLVRVELGRTAALSVTVDSGSAGPAIAIGGNASIDGIGEISVERLRLGFDGLQLQTRFVSSGIDVGGGLVLMPIVSVRAGIEETDFEPLIAIGLATDGVGDRSVQFRWALDALPPRIVIVERTVSGETEISDPTQVALALTAIATSITASVTLDALDPLGADVVDALQNVVFSGGGSSIDPTLFSEFDNPTALANRLYELAFNLADDNLSITIDGKMTIGFTKTGSRAGVFINLDSGERVPLSLGNPAVELEVFADWITTTGVVPGLSMLLLERTGGSFSFDPSVTLAGLGVRVSKTEGPLIDLGIMSIDAVSVHLYGEVQPSALGAGVHVSMDGLAITPTATGGDNAVANNLMSDAAASSSPSSRPSFSPSFAVQKSPGGEVSISLRAGQPPGPWWIPIQRQLGPLYIEQFGFNSTEIDGSVTGISLLFDGGVSLVGLNAAVDQLGLHWLGGDVFDLNNWAVDLQGLAVSADLSGIVISGGLLKTDLDGSIGYVGMLMGRFGIYGLSLFGGYSDDNGRPSFFVFGAVQGAIGGPPAFFLTGLGGGLGINRGLRVPDDLSAFGEYPFIKALDPAASAAENPLDELRQLAEYFPPEDGNIWFAAGISFTSFALVDGVAVVSVSIGNGLEINLFGLARLALPRPQVALVSIELGLLARFSTEEGLFLVQAQLTDNSWLLYPEVRLTGGFAFATWWKGSNAGQFVLTLGGYHPSFSRVGYPIVSRLGLEWRVTDEIVIKGGAYFALTSEALMAGVEVVVSADFGWAYASITFGANAIVYFDPFYFIADAYARISAGIKIKTFFGTIRIGISIGASITVVGPNFHGRATFEVGPCDISVPFGDTSSVRGVYVDWTGFVPKYLEEASTGRARAISGITGQGSLPAATDGGTSAPSSDGSAARPFEVFAEFDIALVTTIPTTTIDFGAAGNNVSIPPTLPDGSSATLGLSPMNVSSLGSTLEIRLIKLTSPEQGDRTDDLRPIVEGITQETDISEESTYGVDAFPIGVWGLPEDTDQPSSPVPKGDIIIAGSRLKLVARATLTGVTGPEIDYYRVDTDRRPLPLSSTGSSRGVLLAEADSLGIEQLATSTSNALNIAREQLFDNTVVTGVPGLVDRGRRSATARASYKRSRTAPPLFGSLAEGVTSLNQSRSDTTIIDIVAPPTGRQPRAPFVSGYMVQGASIATAGIATTVADRSIKRRLAPSTDSVRGRLGRSLPIKLTLGAAPSLFDNQTVIVRGTVPRTNLGNVSRSYRGGHIGSVVGGALVGGLSSRTMPRAHSRIARPQAIEPGSRLRAGDVIALRLPDVAIDSSVSVRPSLKVEGDARVVMLQGNGFVNIDKKVADTTVEVPPHTAVVAVHANGGLDDLQGSRSIKICGWHDQSRIARLGGRSALAAGCVLHVEGPTARARVGWTLAGDMVRRAAAIATCFDADVKTIAVVMRSSDAISADDVGLELHGARRPQVNGEFASPVVVQMGSYAIMLFALLSLPDSNGVIVRITAGGTRQLAGVLGSSSSPDAVADLLGERGLVSIVARLRAGGGDGCQLSWISGSTSGGSPEQPLGGVTSPGGVAQPSSKKASSKKASSKRVASKKASSKKVSSKKKSSKNRSRKR